MDVAKFGAALFLFVLSLLLGYEAFRRLHNKSQWFMPLYLGGITLLGMAIVLMLQVNALLVER